MGKDLELTGLRAELDQKDAVLQTLHSILLRLMEGAPGSRNATSALPRTFEPLVGAMSSIISAKQELETAFDAFSDPIFIHDTEFRILRANRAYAQVAGMPFQRFIGEPYYKVFPRMETPFKVCRQALEFKKEGEEEISPPLTGRIFRMNIYPIRDADGQYDRSIHIFRDITERKQAQERIQQQERLAGVGQLAAGIAHDINNVLVGIMGFVELQVDRPDVPEDAKDDLRFVYQQGERAIHMNRQILDFGSISVSQKHPLNLLAFVRKIANLFRHIFPENIEIKFEHHSGEYWVEADPTQLDRVLTNLAINARDAMPSGGSLTFRFGRLTLTEEVRSFYPGIPCGECIRLEVSDTGTGISPDILPRIFDPFVTTKGRTGGTGLGLAQVYGLVKQHQGHIEVESRVGQGTTFAILLPALGGEKAIGQAKEAIMRGNGETILVVDDEPIVLDATREMLEHLGYRAVTAHNGAEALMIYNQQHDRIALVLTDIVMPGLSGAQLFRALRRKNPEVKVMMMSGCPLNEKTGELMTHRNASWVQKPMHLTRLAQVMRQALI